jgi:hypothetical protein
LRARIRFAEGVLLAAFCGCTPSTSVRPPPGWTEIDAGAFVFSVPPDVKPLPVKGGNPFTSEYMGDSISLDFDYSARADALENAGVGSDYESHEESIGGKKARMASFYFPQSGHPFAHAIGIHFPEAGEKKLPLTMFALCKSKANYGTVATIFRTIRFK